MASNIKGLDKLLAGLDATSRKFQEDVKDIIGINIQDLQLQAIREAPGPGDEIKTEYGTENERDIVNGRGWTPISQAITYTIDPNGFSGRVFVNDSAGDISAWVEFSTGQSAARYLATVPEFWRATAAKYIRNKKGTIIGKPYLYPAYEKYSLQTVKELKQAIKDIKL